MSVPSYDIAIVGGGFSGVCTAYALLRAADRPLRVALCEPRRALGAGVAYGTPSPHHILNVRAKDMSISVDEPDSLCAWLKAREPQFGPLSYPPRMLYLEYLQDQLRRARESSSASLTVVPEEVVRAEQQGDLLLSGERGPLLRSAQVVLALGNLPANFLLAGNELLSSPWDAEAIERAGRSNTVGILGAGLTAIDVIRAVEKAGFQGRYRLFSRHGRWPHPHPDKPVVPSPAAHQAALQVSRQRTTLGALRELRAAVAGGIPWVEVVDALRPHTQQLWGSFALEEKRRFLRHLRIQWDIHRHRAPMECLVMLKELKDSGRITLRAAWVSQAKAAPGGGIEVHTVLRHADPQVVPCDVAFNCLGLCFDVRFLKSPLLQQLLQDGMASPDDMSFGLRTTPAGQLLVGRQPQAGLYTLGPLRRGELWETTAVNEIRAQAQVLAKTLLGPEA